MRDGLIASVDDPRTYRLLLREEDDDPKLFADDPHGQAGRYPPGAVSICGNAQEEHDSWTVSPGSSAHGCACADGACSADRVCTGAFQVLSGLDAE